MTKLKVLTGDVYTPLASHEVRSYLQGGSLAGTIPGFEDAGATVPIIISVSSIVFIYE